MSSGRIIICRTPFVFEDGKIYYFEIRSRGGNDYHDLFCYKRVIINFFLFKSYRYKQIGNNELINSYLSRQNIEEKLCSLIRSNTISAIPGWDGFVGNVPEDLRKSISRNAKLGNILD